MSGPFPLIGKAGTVSLATYPLMVVKGTYVDTEAQRFGDKISIGDIRYADFNPYETA